MARLLQAASRFGLNPSDMMADLLRGGTPAPPIPSPVPHWQVAIDRKFEALGHLQSLLATPDKSVHFRDATDLSDREAIARLVKQADVAATLRNMGYTSDVKALRHAQVYSFNAETIGAIRMASLAIPHESPLTAVKTPTTGSGWFWFGEPIPLAASPIASDTLDALLWSWVNTAPRAESPAIMFSAYVVTRKGSGRLGQCLPSTRWFWPVDMSYDEMMRHNAASYDLDYPPDGNPVMSEGIQLAGREETLRVVGELSLFFLAACLWMQQRVVVSAPGHVERHARKRYVREHQLQEPPTVQVVALRRTERAPAEPGADPDGQAAARTYSHRWIVGWETGGFARLQPVGPGRKDRKLIWIAPFPAGPKDKPLRMRPKVYAVVR
jgi:hypothetical protein